MVSYFHHRPHVSQKGAGLKWKLFVSKLDTFKLHDHKSNLKIGCGEGQVVDVGTLSSLKLLQALIMDKQSKDISFSFDLREILSYIITMQLLQKMT